MRVDGYLDVSEKLATKIASGEVRIITEAVARNSDARIYEYVPFVTTLTEDKNDNTVNNVLNVSNKKIVIGLGVGALVLSTIAIVTGTVFYFKNKKNMIDKECQENFDKYLKQYLIDARNGNINIETLERLICAIDKISEKNKKGVVILSINIEEFLEMVYAIYSFTKQLVEKNSIEEKTIEAPKRSSCVKDLRQYLVVQHSVLKKVA